LKKRFIGVFVVASFCCIVYFLSYLITIPNDEVFLALINSNGVTINGRDTDILDDKDLKYDRVTYIPTKNAIQEFEIIEWGYDILQKRYFCIASYTSSEEEYFFSAKVMIFTQHKKEWYLIEDIGVLEARFHSN